MRRPPAVALLPFLAGCTFAPGGPMSTLHEVRVTGEAAATELETGDGRTVALDRAELVLGTVSLQALAGGGGGGSFDPADPPEGFSLCHNGHCHYVDGSLWSYGEIEVWLAGDSASWSEVGALVHPAAYASDGTPDEVRLDLLDPEDLVRFEGPLLLGTGDLDRVHLDGTLLLAGRIVQGAQEAEISMNASLAEGLVGNLGVEVDRDLPAAVALDLSWTLPADLLEGAALEVGWGEALVLDSEDEDTEVAVAAAEGTLLEAELLER